MTARLEVRPFASADVDGAAALLADRHRHNVSAMRGLSVRLAEPAVCAAALVEAAEANAWVACRGAELVGFLVGHGAGRFGFIPGTGHAVALSETDPTACYGALYSKAATTWVASGTLIHDVEVTSEHDVTEAWNNLGFGRRTCIAVRNSAPLDGDPVLNTAIDVRIGTAADLDSIARLAVFEEDFRAAAPLFADMAAGSVAERADHHRTLLDEGAVHLLASRDGADVGLLTLERMSPSPLLTVDEAPFVGPTSVDPTVRGGGVGQTLVAAALEWCRANGAPWVGVSFNPPNLSSRPFWLGCGFQPTGWKLARRLPEGPFPRPRART